MAHDQILINSSSNFIIQKSLEYYSLLLLGNN